MIINSVRAENVLKYRSLSIDLAEKGLIAISGQNESGKSTIGETVCFALFGRTFSIPPEEITKVVRWGENHCNVTLAFAVEDRGYVLSRFLDRDGNHSAKLAFENMPDEPLARGVGQVSDTLFDILGFEYAEFVESFYLAQREITTPHPHSQAIKIMAGIAPLEVVSRQLDREIADRRELLEEMQAEWDAIEQQVVGLGIREGRLAKLEDERAQAEAQAGELDALVADINAGVETCQENTSEIYRIQGAKQRNGFLRFIVFLLALLFVAAWGLLAHAADLPQAEQVRQLLAENVPQWDETRIPWLGYAAAALAVLFVLLTIRGSGLKRRISKLREESAQLGQTLEKARAIEVEDVPDDHTTAIQAGEHDEAVPGLEDSFPARPGDTEFHALQRMLVEGEATSRMAREFSEREVAWLSAVAEHLKAQVGDLIVDIEDEQKRLQEAMNLSDVLDGVNARRAEVEQKITERMRGVELLGGAIEHLAGHFNRDVKELVGRLLPLFTDGRYQHLQIDEGLKVRVFSNEKRDFMDLDEVSSGTQRQVMLALRLALSQKLLSRTVKGRQFAFLDEPFAFFDDERTCSALQALTKLGDDMSQVWIVAQGFPSDCEVRFDTHVHCDRSSDTLEVRY
jgi:exonuclease SbcC